jgi:hypothetical protein
MEPFIKYSVSRLSERLRKSNPFWGVVCASRVRLYGAECSRRIISFVLF